MRVNFDEKGENIIGPAIFTDLSILGKYWGIMENGGGRAQDCKEERERGEGDGLDK